MEGDTLINFSSYSALYNTQYLVSRWVSYKLTRENLIQNNRPCEKEVVNNYKIGVLPDKDAFKFHNYITGHLIPINNLCYSYKSNQEGNFITNLTPQDSTFNKSLWRRLEIFTDSLTKFFDTVYITTGCIFDKNIKRTKHNIAIPNYYFKVILGFHNDIPRTIAFLMSNKNCLNPINDFIEPLETIQNISGLEFFSCFDNNKSSLIVEEKSLEFWRHHFQDILTRKPKNQNPTVE